MSPERAAALVAGLLQLAGTAAGILSIASSLDAGDYLTRAAVDAHRVRLAAFAQVVMALTYGASRWSCTRCSDATARCSRSGSSACKWLRRPSCSSGP